MNKYRINRAKYGTHQLIAEEIGKNKKVLDVGCNSGYLALLANNNEYHGIDQDKKSLQEAKINGYKNVYKVDLNYPQRFAINEKYDVIVFADILEHLINPETVLKYFINNHLAKGGKVIISLPNVANISIRFKILLGDFTYTESGILDKTHLHLYTLKTAKELINSCDLTIIKELFSSNNFGGYTKLFPIFGSLLGFNMIFICH